MVGLSKERLPSWVSGKNPVFHKRCLFPNHRENHKTTERQRRAAGSRMTWKNHPVLLEKQKMQIRTNLIHTPPFDLPMQGLLHERAVRQILWRSLEKALERGTVKTFPHSSASF